MAQKVEGKDKMITPDQYNSFIIEWYSGHYPRQRFGQAFINKFALADAPDYDTAPLFYETNLIKAKERAWRDFVDRHGCTSGGP